jgi:hypothetical protein
VGTVGTYVVNLIWVDFADVSALWLVGPCWRFGIGVGVERKWWLGDRKEVKVRSVWGELSGCLGISLG